MMVSFPWCPFGPPKPQQRTEFPEPKFSRSCKNFCSAKLELGDGIVQIEFEEDTFWSKDVDAKEIEDGVAVVKVGLRVRGPSDKLLSKVECSTTFSQPVEGQFRGVHHCWPARSTAQSHAQQNGHGSVSNFSTSRAGPDPLAQNLDAQRELSSGEASGIFDMVKYTLDMRNENLHVNSAEKKLFGAAVLQCARGELIVRTLLRVFSKRLWYDLRVESTSVHEIATSMRFMMTHRDPGSILCASCAKIEDWVHTKNHGPPQNGLFESPGEPKLRLMYIQGHEA
jgi:hypothetical protein